MSNRLLYEKENRTMKFRLSWQLSCPLSRYQVFAGLWLATAGMTAGGADFPEKPVRFVVGFTPGGPSDIVARLLGQKLAEGWNQQVVIDNRAGAGGNIAAEIVAKAPGDGYTLLLGNNSILATNAALYSKLNFDPVRDFAPVILVASQPNILVVHPSLPDDA
jgi:tripartite-type tricarboxylate transporter receptor subunit TctC